VVETGNVKPIVLANKDDKLEFSFNAKNIVTNLTRTLQSSRFLGGPIFYPVFKNGATGSTPPPFLGGF
jgi:hypothetical protein